MRLTRRALLGSLASLPLAGRPAGANEFYPVPVELIADLDRLQGSVRLGAAQPDITLYEFFDYNCGFCRRTARDIRPLLEANRDLAIVLVNYAVLGIPSIGATRVALAFSRQRAERYLAFHEQLFQQRGVIGAEQAIAVAQRNGAERARLLADADSDPVTAAMRAASQLGQQLGFVATPSYLVGRDGFAGFLDRAAKQAAIDAFRRCERAACG
jgi:protein-disulfide isomerase